MVLANIKIIQYHIKASQMYYYLAADATGADASTGADATGADAVLLLASSLEEQATKEPTTNNDAIIFFI